MDVLEIKTKDELEAWFKERPPAIAQVVAVRAALRALPYVVEAKSVENFASDILLPVFWAVATSWVARKYPAHDVSTSAAAASAASAAILLEAAVTSETVAATAVLNASVAAAHAAASSTTAAYAVDAVFFACSASDPAYFVDVLSDEALWNESLQDCAFLEDALKHNVKAENVARDLVGQRLWREQKMPRDIHERWNELQSFLLNVGDNWEVWDSWYYTRFEGIKTIEVTSDLMEKADVGIATLGVEFWQLGPAVVNAEIQRLMDGGAPTNKFDDAAKRQVLEGMKSEVDKFFKGHSQKFAAEVKKTRSEQEEKFSERLDALLLKHIDDVKTETEQGRKDVKQAASDVTAGVRGEKNFKESFGLWKNKKRAHQWSFWLGILVFFALIAGLGWVGWKQLDWITSLFNEVSSESQRDENTVGDTAQLLSRFLVFSLPIAIVIWILRAVLRFANLNLSLAEDAAQREVMAKTYINLLASGQLTEKEDRQLMLAALFRPLPGIQEIDAAPTSLFDFINPAKAKK